MKKIGHALIHCTVDDGVNKPFEIVLAPHDSFQLIARLHQGESDFITMATLTVDKVYSAPPK